MNCVFFLYYKISSISPSPPLLRLMHQRSLHWATHLSIFHRTIKCIRSTKDIQSMKPFSQNISNKLQPVIRPDVFRYPFIMNANISNWIIFFGGRSILISNIRWRRYENNSRQKHLIIFGNMCIWVIDLLPNNSLLNDD